MKNVETYQLLLPIFNDISKAFKATEIIDNANGTYKITTCSTLWLSINKKLTIDSIEYKIIDIAPDEWILLKGPSLPTLMEFDIYPFYTFQGTVLAQQQALDNIPNSESKLPMIWLHEITKERTDTDIMSSLDRESECDIYFLVDANMEDWLTEQHYKYAIRPMRYLLDAFVDSLKRNTGLVYADHMKYDQYDHAKFGQYMESKGHVKSIFNDHLSGTQFRGTISFYADAEFGICCN